MQREKLNELLVNARGVSWIGCIEVMGSKGQWPPGCAGSVLHSCQSVMMVLVGSRCEGRLSSQRRLCRVGVGKGGRRGS